MEEKKRCDSVNDKLNELEGLLRAIPLAPPDINTIANIEARHNRCLKIMSDIEDRYPNYSWNYQGYCVCVYVA
jgi:hypothetical protein